MEETKKRMCKVCGRELPESEFINSHYGLHKTCKECEVKKRQATRKGKSEVEALRQELEELRKARLSSFTPREMMEELARQGYTGKLKYVVEKEIDICCF